MRKQFVIRVRLVFVALLAIAFLLVVRLYFVQVVYGEEYRQEAEGQYVAPAEDIVDRGTIYFSDKEAATMRSGYRIVIRPSAIKDAEATYAAINAITPIDYDRFMASSAKKEDPYEEIAVRVSTEDGDAVSELKLSGVSLVRDRWRFYPGGSVGAQVLGFVGFGPNNPDHPRGLYGLEKYWDDMLARGGEGLYVNFFAETFANIQSLIADNGAAREADIVTTINPAVQQQLEEVLHDIDRRYASRTTGGIVMDPKTGAIVAMAATPSYNPNNYGAATSTAYYRNPLVENEYELGSIMKPITMASGIDAGVVTPGTTYNDQGFVMKSGYRINNYDFRGRGPGTTMQEVLNQSLNTGVVFVTDKLGREGFKRYLQAFGFGEETGVDLPGEVPGRIAAFSSGSDVDYASASFGQSVSFTPIAMTRALSVLANGGLLVQPHVTEAFEYTSGMRRENHLPEPVRVISSETAETVSRMLSKVYDDALLGGEVKMEHYSIAAKTGTAQIADAAGGGYYADRYLHSFFGYFPAFDSRFIVFLFTVDPRGEQYASQTLARPFAQIAQFLINYYEIPPDR